MRKSSFLALSALMVMIVGGCAATREAGWRSGETVQMSPQEVETALSQAKQYWMSRHEKEELLKALKEFERIAKSDPTHYEAHLYLTRGYYLLADGHLEIIDEKKKNWEIGLAWGERALATHPEFRKKVVDNGETLADSLDVLTEKEAGALYWSAVNLGKWAKESGIATVLRYNPQAQKMITRVGELDPDYFYGAVDRFWAVYYAVAPSFAGGSLDKSEERFKKTFSTAKNYFPSHVLYAENYATKRGNKNLFRKHLEFVLSTPESVLPDVIPEQILEKRKAKMMLERIEDYF
jgi:hypothetical protein